MQNFSDSNHQNGFDPYAVSYHSKGAFLFASSPRRQNFTRNYVDYSQQLIFLLKYAMKHVVLFSENHRRSARCLKMTKKHVCHCGMNTRWWGQIGGFWLA